MKSFIQLLFLPALLLACASHQKTTDLSPNEIERNPTGVKELVVLQDKYADNKVIFCDDKTAVVTSDPNKCGEAMANGSRGCTEMAGYISKPLNVEVAGKSIRLKDGNGKVVHELALGNGPNYTLSLSKGSPTISLVQTKVEAARASFYYGFCKQ